MQHTKWFRDLIELGIFWRHMVWIEYPPNAHVAHIDFFFISQLKRNNETAPFRMFLFHAYCFLLFSFCYLLSLLPRLLFFFFFFLNPLYCFFLFFWLIYPD